jgi:UMF1 family MFS transporter
MADNLKKRAIRAWTMYDWANSAFATTIMGAVLPNYFSAFIAGENSLTLWAIPSPSAA